MQEDIPVRVQPEKQSFQAIYIYNKELTCNLWKQYLLLQPEVISGGSQERKKDKKCRSKDTLELVRMGRTHEDGKTPLVSCYLQTLRFNDMGVLQKMLEPFVIELDINLAQEYRNERSNLARTRLLRVASGNLMYSRHTSYPY